MRVISGSARGMALHSVKGAETRPTSDFVKENLFNIIRDDVRGSVFLDLFAGTGAIGIEALSRGAAQAVFVDISQKSIDVIRRNLEKSRLKERAVVMKDDALRAVKKLAERKLSERNFAEKKLAEKKLAEQKRRFDIIYADPPYFEGLTARTLDCIAKHGILADNGYVVVEMSKAHDLPKVRGLQILKTKEYSSTRLVFLGMAAAEAASRRHTILEENNDCSIPGEF